MTPSQRLSLSLGGCVILATIVFAGIQWWSTPARAPEPPSTRETAEDGPAPEREARIERLQAKIDAQRQALREARRERSSVTGELEHMNDELSSVQDRLDELRREVESGTAGQEAPAAGGSDQ